MFQESPDLFANIQNDHRPDRSAPAQVTTAPVPAADGLGLSPDGLGHYGMAGPIAMLEPGDTSVEAAVRSAGITVLLATVAGVAGLALGGPWGTVSGLSFTGGAFNVYRAQKWWGSADPSEKHEAVVSSIIGAINVVVGGYSAYRAYQSREGDDE